MSTCESGDGFVKLALVKVPDTSNASVDGSLSLKKYKEKCFADCSYVAYTSANESTMSGCLTWHGDMVDTRAYTPVGQDLYVRVESFVIGTLFFYHYNT